MAKGQKQGRPQAPNGYADVSKSLVREIGGLGVYRCWLVYNIDSIGTVQQKSEAKEYTPFRYSEEGPVGKTLEKAVKWLEKRDNEDPR